MPDDSTRLIVFAVDMALDDAWQSQTDIPRILALARRLSTEVGREPLIEDAKLLVAAERNCTPSEAFELLVRTSKSHNIKVAELARRLVETNQPRPAES
jgi:AmiR/NasT family two-component response regulator